MIWRWLERVAVLVTVAGLGYWSVTTYGPVLWQRWADREFDRHIEQPPSPVEPAPEPPPKTRDVVGRIEIPRLRLEAIVREGTDAKTLGLSAGHIPGTALPGHKGNVAIAAHRDTLFRGLQKIEKNDLIRVDDPKGGHAFYQVATLEIVKPTDVGVLKPEGKSELTLVTCYPFNYIGSAPDRFIVKAREIAAPAVSSNGVITDVPDRAPVRPVALETAAEPKPAPVRQYRIQPIPYRQTDEAAPEQKIFFTVNRLHSRQLAPGVSVGITDTDPDNQAVEGWLWLMPERRTVWLRSQAVGDPLRIESGEGERTRRVVITKVTEEAVSGYLVN
jgi:sortase A